MAVLLFLLVHHDVVATGVVSLYHFYLLLGHRPYSQVDILGELCLAQQILLALDHLFLNLLLPYNLPLHVPLDKVEFLIVYLIGLAKISAHHLLYLVLVLKQELAVFELHLPYFLA